MTRNFTTKRNDARFCGEIPQNGLFQMIKARRVPGFMSYPHAESNRNRQNRNLKFYPLNYRGVDIFLSPCKVSQNIE